MIAKDEPNIHTTRSRLNRRRIGLALAGAAAIVTGLSFFGRAFWLAEILSHFRPQLALGAALLAVLALVTRQRLNFAVAATLMVANASPLLAYVAPLDARAAPADATSIKIITFNLHGHHADRRALERLVARERPDIVVLTELPRAPHARSEVLAGAFPELTHVMIDDGGSPHDVVIHTRWRPLAASTDRSISRILPVMSVDLCEPQESTAPSRCLRLVALHAARPLDGGAQARDAQLERAASLAAAAPSHRAIVAGDLNLTPWSPVFADLLARGGLRDSALGRGLVGTWLSRFILFGLPIDHVLVSPAFDVHDRRIGPDLGSDHLPVIVELRLR